MLKERNPFAPPQEMLDSESYQIAVRKLGYFMTPVQAKRRAEDLWFAGVLKGSPDRKEQQ